MIDRERDGEKERGRLFTRAAVKNKLHPANARLLDVQSKGESKVMGELVGSISRIMCRISDRCEMVIVN